MSDLIAIGYPDEQTAELAAEEARRLAKDLIIEPDAIASIVRDKEGKFHVHTSHHPVGAGASWGMFWGLLFGLLFFIPFFGLAIGAGMGALMGKVTKSGIDREFQDQVRGLLKPGTSALFLMVEKVTPDKATEALDVTVNSLVGKVVSQTENAHDSLSLQMSAFDELVKDKGAELVEKFARDSGTLGALITRREPLDSFADALGAGLDQVKVVLDLTAGS